MLDRSAFVLLYIRYTLVSLGPKPVIVLIINKRLCAHSQGFPQTKSDFLAESESAEQHQRCPGPLFNQPECWDLRKGFVPSGPPAAALVSLFLLPASLDGQTLRHGDIPPPTHHALSL